MKIGINQAVLHQQEQDKKNQEAKAYLASTDWYVIRLQEQGTPIPQDILDARQAARDSIIEVTNA